MPRTVEDLGRRVKAKYPGAYDDIGDADLGRKVKAKYPGAYDDFTEIAKPSGPGETSRTWADSVADFLSSAWSQVNPVEAVKGLAAVGSDPVGAGKALLQGQGDLRSQSLESFKRGDYLTGIRQAFNYAIPLLGPAMESAGSKLAEGKVAEGLGETVGLGVSIAAPAVANPAARGVARVAARAARTVSPAVDPTVAIVRALPKIPDKAVDNLPNTLARIKAESGVTVTGNKDLLHASNLAIRKTKQAFGEWLEQARGLGTQVSGDSVVEATRAAIPKTMWQEEPAAAARIVQEAQSAYGGRTFTVDQMHQFLKEKNAATNAFYSKAQDKQIASVIAGKPEAVIKAQRDAIADALYKALDPENAGAGPRAIQREISEMLDVQKAARQQRKAIIREKPASNLEGVGKRAGAILDLPGKAAVGDLEGGVGKVAHATSGASDALIKRAFKAAGDAPALPRPLPAQPAAGLLSPGARVTPPPADPSGIKVTTGPMREGRPIQDLAVRPKAPVQTRESIPAGGQPRLPAGREPKLLPAAREAKGNLSDRALSAITSREAPTTMLRLREQLGNPSKADFDVAVRKLVDDKKIYITKHDHGHALTPAQRADLDLVQIDGEWYTAASPRRAESGGTKLMAESGGTKLWRAANDAPQEGKRVFWAEDLASAKEYRKNPGFGGKDLYKTEVHPNPERTLDLVGGDEFRKLADAIAGDVGVDAYELADKLRDSGYVFEAWENSSKVMNAIRKRYDWVRFEDNFPEGSITWMDVRGLGARNAKALRKRPKTR